NDQGEDEIERTAKASKGLKQICKDLNIAGIAIHSLNKGGIGAGTPDNNGLRGSAQVKYDADLIMYLVNYKPISEQDKRLPENERDNLRTILFGKGRELESRARYIHLTKKGEYPFFGELVHPQVHVQETWCPPEPEEIPF
ncbi:MAG: DnaB-like helicase C-terminal domain-containing protein, partial [Syntrophobacteraceae bacterium]